MKFTTKGMSAYIESGAAVQTSDVITAVTNAAPAVVTPTTGASFADGDVVFITGTGMASIDDQYWIVANHAGTTFELQCSDSSGEAAAATTGTATPYKIGTDLLLFCLSSFSRDAPAADVIDVSTWCGRDQLSGEPELGSVSWGGPIDYCDLGISEMLRAFDDGNTRVVLLVLPKSQGKIIYRLVVNQYTETFDTNAAGVWTGGALVKLAPNYRVCEGCT